MGTGGIALPLLGGAALGATSGGKGGGNGGATNDAARKMASWYYRNTDPLRKAFISEGETALAGDYKPWQTETYKYIKGLTDKQVQPIYDQAMEPAKRVIESQYQRAQEDALSNMPSGGALSSALANVGLSRAQSLGDTERQLRMADIQRQDIQDQWQSSTLADMVYNMNQDMLNKGYGLAAGAPAQSLSTLTNLAGQNAMANAQSQAGKANMMGGLGQGAGLLLGMGK